MVELLQYKINAIEFQNRVAVNTEIKLKNETKYNVNFIEKDLRAVGTLNLKICDDDMKPFSINIEIEGIFSYEKGDEQADVHVASFDQLYPYVKTAVATICAASGIPLIPVPFVHLDKNQVDVRKNPNANSDEGEILN